MISFSHLDGMKSLLMKLPGLKKVELVDLQLDVVDGIHFLTHFFLNSTCTVAAFSSCARPPRPTKTLRTLEKARNMIGNNFFAIQKSFLIEFLRFRNKLLINSDVD